MPKKTIKTDPVPEPIDLSVYDDLLPRTRGGDPLWKGPSGEGPQGGVTFSLLSRFLNCRERFRLLVIEGLRSRDGFNHRIEYGSLWHAAEEAFASGGDPVESVKGYARRLCKRYPADVEQIQHWVRVCLIQFPIYLNYWSAHPDVIDRVNLLSEVAFDVLYTLPSGKVVRLRGKRDNVDLIGRGKDQKIYLQENKTKGDINPNQLRRQLTFDLQTMIYLIALKTEMDAGNPKWLSSPGWKDIPLGGIRYNVVRRPLAGGKYSIRQNKSESLGNFYSRLSGLIDSDPEFFFMRWKVEIGGKDIEVFRSQCLDPILEQLCDWWEYMLARDAIIDSYSDVWAFNKGIHWRHPYGIYNVLDEGGSTEYDEYLDHRSEIGLDRTTDLFPELGTG